MEKNELNTDESKLQFGDFEVHVATEQLLRNGETVRLEPQLFACLLLLLRNAGQVVSRKDVEQQIWAGRFVSDEAVRASFKKLRQVLGDSARDPKYIKTVPKQGYKLVAKVQEIDADVDASDGSSQSEPDTVRRYKFGLIAAAVSVCVLLILLFVRSSPPHSTDRSEVTNPQPLVQVQPLTQMSGSEVFADYHAPSQRLLFAHRANSNSPQQMYIKHLPSGQVQRLTWDDAHYTDMWWSPDGARIAYSRQKGGSSALYIATLGQADNVISTSKLDTPALTQKFVVSWSQDGNTLYLAESSLTIKSRGIHRYHIDSQRLEPTTAPSVTGVGDFFAAESPDGNQLAVLRETSPGQFALVVVSLRTGSLLANRTLSIKPSRVIWHEDLDQLTVSSFTGQLARFSLHQDRFIELPEMPVNSNDVFAACGSQCYFMRQHNGNYFNIQERPTPLSHETALNVTLTAATMFDINGAEDLPVYNQSGDTVYFVSLNQNEVSIKRQQHKKTAQTLAIWSAAQQVSAIQVSPNEEYLAGIVDGRLFILPLTRFNLASSSEVAPYSAPEYLTSAMEVAANPSWHHTLPMIYFSTSEQSQAYMASIDVHSKRRERVLDGYVAMHSFPSTSPEAVVAIDEESRAWFLPLAAEEEKALIGSVQTAHVHRSKSTPLGLFHSVREGRGAFLEFMPFPSENPDSTNVPRRASLGDNRFSLHFDLHPGEDKLLLVESLSAQSNLVKVSW